ncbi:MAG: trypsin-like peptidase domain-containing protein [Lachnospiraceae bacterium]|nr:trypsin-like peptidase domain-containing protein [Lachnospiraceae bacterium]
MYENNNYYEYNSTEGNYGAAPNTNGEPSSSKQEKHHKKMPRVVRKFGMMIVSGVAFGLAASLVFIGVLKASGIEDKLAALDSAQTIGETVMAADEAAIGTVEVGADASNQTSQSASAEQVTNKDRSEYSVAEIAKSCMPSIVSITNKGVEEVRSMFGTRQYESTSAGSGIIIGQNEEELLIATNNHVVANATEISVCFGDDEDKVVEAKVKGTDADNDLGIIAVDLDDLTDEIKSSISIAKIGNSSDVKVGDQVVAIGNALGYGQSVTTGIVSAMDREVTIEGMTAKLIQTDAAINPGNSGGALLNMKGELIGINSSKFASSVVEGMGYAIPIDTAEPILEELMNRETRDLVATEEQGYLGITCQNVSSDISEMYNIPQGVYVLELQKDGAAEKAGLVKGDIITKFDGMSISDYDDLKSSLQYYKAGETVELVIQRAKEAGGYEEKILQVTLIGDDGRSISSQNQDSTNSNGGNDNSGQNGGSSAEDFFREFFDYYNNNGNNGMSSGR